MRIWDVNPGYLNRQSLLGEHRELHGIVSIIVQGKKGYSRHPETLRWVGYGWALQKRHQLLAAEMALRGFTDRSPVLTRSRKGRWPEVYIDEPAQQISLLRDKYSDKEPGRIPLPKNAQQLWAHHKYSVLARDTQQYKKIGKIISTMRSGEDFSRLAQQVTELLQLQPTAGNIRNALQHMWGHISDHSSMSRKEFSALPLHTLLKEVQNCAMAVKEPYLVNSTALSELAAWLPKSPVNR